MFRRQVGQRQGDFYRRDPAAAFIHGGLESLPSVREVVLPLVQLQEVLLACRVWSMPAVAAAADHGQAGADGGGREEEAAEQAVWQEGDAAAEADPAAGGRQRRNRHAGGQAAEEALPESRETAAAGTEPRAALQPAAWLLGPSSAGLPGPPASGLLGPSTAGLPGPSTAGLLGPSTAGLLGPCTAGLLGPCTAGLLGPSAWLLLSSTKHPVGPGESPTETQSRTLLSQETKPAATGF